MNRVWVWVTRNDGQVEQHIGPFERALRNKDGKRLVDPEGNALYDTDYVDMVMKAVGGFDGQYADAVAKGISAKDIERDKTGAIRQVAVGLKDIADRVIDRQQRAESRQRVDAGGQRLTGFPPLRALWLADIELAQMTVHVRAE